MNAHRKRRPLARAVRAAPGVGCLALAMIAAPASAQELPERVAIVRPSGDPVRAVAAVALARERLPPDATVQSSPLTWPDLQLAAGCVAETDACFSAVAAQLEVDAILLPALEDPEGAVALTRWRRGTGVRRERLDPAAPAASVARAPTRASVVEPARASEGDDAGPPLLIAAGSALALALGVPFAVAAEASAAEWRSIPVQTQYDAVLAESTHARAMREAVVADVAVAVGIGAVVTGITWWILDALGGDR